MRQAERRADYYLTDDWVLITPIIYKRAGNELENIGLSNATFTTAIADSEMQLTTNSGSMAWRALEYFDQAIDTSGATAVFGATPDAISTCYITALPTQSVSRHDFSFAVAGTRIAESDEFDQLAYLSSGIRTQSLFDDQFSKRVAELVAAAADEKLDWSNRSLEDLRSFFAENRISISPSLALTDNGLFMAEWRNARKELISLQFRGNREVTFVLFAWRSGNALLARNSGFDSLPNISKLIAAMALESLLAS